MIVGKIVHGKSYAWIDYIEATVITLGVSFFTFSEKDPPAKDSTDSMMGVFLVVMYLFCDSFTSQWQDRVFKTYKVDQYQMMLGINSFSITFTFLSVLVSASVYR